jgi:peptide/nickel transport system substrate-binding protein
MKLNSPFGLVFCALLMTGCISAQGVTLRVANQGDILSLDPHAMNEGLQLDVLLNVYEPLVSRNLDYKPRPLLATHWAQTAPTVWRFVLREGVHFHDGTPFAADDVVFSLQRAHTARSAMRSYVGEITRVSAMDSHTVEIETRVPQPILPQMLSHVYMMSRKWCEGNSAMEPADALNRVENAASRGANGTGPFRLAERHPDAQTTFARNRYYWENVKGNVDEVVFMPIANGATRLAALLSGEVDVIDPLAVQDAERVKNDPRLKVLKGPELRVIFLGMDQQRDELLYASVKGRNPFKDRRVRQAFYQAIDIQSIQAIVMRRAAIPTALLIPPGVTGYPPELAERLPFNVESARKLLADAGYPGGFELKMNCPNDRYVNDSAICQAIASNLARVGIRITVQAETKGIYFPKVLRRDTSLYLLGWSSATGDAHVVMQALMASPGEGGRGQWNLGSYSNPRFDDLTARIAVEPVSAKRSDMIREALAIHQNDIGHIPLHQQTLSWGARRDVDLVQWPDNGMPWQYIKIGVRPGL